jgi:hypothetical protein
LAFFQGGKVEAATGKHLYQQANVIACMHVCMGVTPEIRVWQPPPLQHAASYVFDSVTQC